ncbi:RNA-directed DNA polymerase, eukaryota [Tanacetum coccineum]
MTPHQHLSDHKPILMCELVVDYGPTLFHFFHSWFSKSSFDKLVEETWTNLTLLEPNNIILLKKKFQALKAAIKNLIKEDNKRSNVSRSSIQSRLLELDKLLDQGNGSDGLVIERSMLLKELQDFNASSSLDMAQKAKIRWSIKGDESDWIDEPSIMKNEFFSHFADRFSSPPLRRIGLDAQFPKRISSYQNKDLERNVTYDEIKYWKLIDQDVVNVVSEFFSSGKFPLGCNSSFITLIPKMQDAKVIKDFRPISLIGSVYKIIVKLLANRLSLVIPDLISDVQSAFVTNRQILDGPFIINELISWCKLKKTKAMIFKVDFEKSFNSARWDYLDDILNKFGFGVKWRNWIQGCLNSAMGSILVNGSLTFEFKFHKGLKQGDPLSPFLFILVMENLHLSFNNILNVGLYKDIQIDNSLTLSYLFYADDAVFIGKWDKSNINTIVSVLNCFFLASSLKINLHKSKLMGINIPQAKVFMVANSIGCTTLKAPFNYLGVKKILDSKKNGGLGVSSFFALNRALLFKWIWRFISNDSSLWYRCIKAIYGDCGALDNPGILARHFPWIVIIREFNSLSSKGINLHSFMKKKVGNAAKFRDSSMFASFRRAPRGGLEEEQLHLLVDKVAPVILSSLNDRWVWTLDSTGDFTGLLDRLHMRFDLSLRGIDVSSILCPICSSAGETSSHLLFSCNVARQLLLKVARWWELEIQDFYSYVDWLSWFNAFRLSKGLKCVLEGVFYVMWWVIWKLRNQLVFGSSHPRLELLFDEIVLMSYTWCSSRCKSKFDWISWMKCPNSLSL